ncbi:uncharacterized protein DS421_12g370800 [Arachis hypogaea]|nr:uncharacterized protein DS421_12g370800 [Arachis hypogaea]
MGQHCVQGVQVLEKTRIAAKGQMKKEEALAGGHVMNVTRRNSKQGPEFVNANDIIARPLKLDFKENAEADLDILGELVVAADIFGMELDMSKVLVPNEHCCGTREALWTLRLEKELVNDVLNVVAGMLTDQRPDHRRW